MKPMGMGLYHTQNTAEIHYGTAKFSQNKPNSHFAQYKYNKNV